MILALGSVQATNGTIVKAHPDKPVYQAAVDACPDIENLLRSSPEAALEKLAPIFAEIDKGTLKDIERQIFIEGKAQEFREHAFYPYNLRGRARLLLARKRKDVEARRLLIDAVADLRASVDRKAADRSMEPLGDAHKELWENVRAALTYEEGWKKERAALADQAVKLISTSPLSKEASDWLAGEIRRVETHLRDLRKTVPDLEARRGAAAHVAEWDAALAAAVAAFPDLRAAAVKTGALAASIRDSKGSFRLKIGVNPWAKVQRLARRDGDEIALADRDTPLLIAELEIDDYTVELVHPNYQKTVSLLANSFQPGQTYVLWGDMSGEIKVAELLK